MSHDLAESLAAVRAAETEHARRTCEVLEAVLPIGWWPDLGAAWGNVGDLCLSARWTATGWHCTASLDGARHIVARGYAQDAGEALRSMSVQKPNMEQEYRDVCAAERLALLIRDLAGRCAGLAHP
jgi:hypothetical protein